MKKLIFITWLGLIFGGIIALFWYNSWKYELPTPVPENYVRVSNGTYIALPADIALATDIASPSEISAQKQQKNN